MHFFSFFIFWHFSISSVISSPNSLSRIISSTNFNAQFNNNMYVTLLSLACFGPWPAHPQEEQLHKHSIWYPCSPKRLYTTPVESGLLLLNCALKLVEEIILYYDAWLKKHQIT